MQIVQYAWKLSRSCVNRSWKTVGGFSWQSTSTQAEIHDVSRPNDQVSGNLRLPVASARHGDFIQAEPRHENAWSSDEFLQSYLRRLLPTDLLGQIEPDLNRFGERVAGDIWRLGRECEENPPTLRQYDAWGKRIDQIITCSAWKAQKAISAEEGLIAIPYEQKQGEYSRVYQAAKLYLYSPASGLYSCPLAMTDGAAKTIQSQGLALPEAWHHLTSRSPEEFWTAGQWMTERRGGSDVGQGTETVALKQVEGSYSLHGYKWFSSATDSDMALTLARVMDSQGSTQAGSNGLSMFYVKLRNELGQLNNIQVVKLKNKLGTRQLPTAELLLDGTRAEMVSDEGRGVASISSMLTITRLHNIISSVAGMRKILSLARDFATRRQAFRQRIDRHPLHIQSLARMEVETRGCCILMLDLARQMGQHDSGCIPDQELLLLRLMTPVAKFYTGKMAVATISEGLECFGGQGYIEDTGLPCMLRDAQVLPIWEGTSNVMSLDVVRAISKTRGEALTAFYSRVSGIVATAEGHAELGACAEKLQVAVTRMLTMVKENPEMLEYAARDFALSLATTYIAALLIEHALVTKEARAVEVARMWGSRDMAPLLGRTNEYTRQESDMQRDLVYANYTLPL